MESSCSDVLLLDGKLVSSELYVVAYIPSNSPFSVASAMANSLQGHFLVAAKHLRDPNFHHAVILVIEDNDEGAMGLVINRPSSLTVDSAFSQVDQPVLSSAPIFSGGPVETTALFILHNCAELGGTDESVTSDIFLTGSNDSFESLVKNEQHCDHECGFRVYCGYAGWDSSQLQGEIDRGDWMVLSAEGHFVFDVDPYVVWDQCVQQVRESNRVLPREPSDPRWN